MPPDIPPQLQKTVWREGDALGLWIPARTWRRELANKVSVGLVGLGTLATLLTFGVGLLFWLFWIPAMVALWLWVGAAPMEHRPARFGAHGSVRLGGLFAPRIPKVRRVAVTGQIGEPCEVFIDDRCILSARMGTAPWTPSALTWFVNELVRTLGVPLEDYRDNESWAEWERNPVYRAAVTWDVERAENREAFPTYFRTPPRPPRSVEMDHHGMTAVVREGLPPFIAPIKATFTMDTLKCGGVTVELADIVRAGFFVRRSGDEETVPGIVDFQVLTRQQWVRLFQIEGVSDVHAWASVLRWLEAEILQRADDARARNPAEEGEAADVPAALRAMVRHRSETA